MTKTKDIRFNLNKLLSYNRILNMVCALRSYGKTYRTTKYVVNRFLKHHEQFVYVRRYKPDLKHVATFFDSLIKENEFPDVNFEVRGKEFYIDGEIAGWAVPLSSAQSYKSVSFPNVTTIFFDEFLIEKGKTFYLPNEPEILLNLMDTIIRDRDNVRVICMANAVTVANPYFLYFNVVPDPDKEYTVTKNIVINTPDGHEFAEERQKTKLGSLIRSTPYGAYSLDNKFVGDSNTFIMPRSKSSRFLGAVKYHSDTIGLWLGFDEGLIYASEKADPSYPALAVTSSDHGLNTYLISNYTHNPLLTQFVKAYKIGYLRFESQKVKHLCYDMLKNFNIR
jgi:hypothetical protein